MRLGEREPLDQVRTLEVDAPRSSYREKIGPVVAMVATVTVVAIVIAS